MPAFWNNIFIILGGIASVFIVLEFFGAKEWLQKLKPVSKLRLVLFLAALCVLGIGIYGKITSAAVTSENIQYHVREWLEDFRVENQKGDIPKARFSYLVALRGKKMTIAQPNDHYNFLSIGCKMSLAGDIQTLFNSKSNAERAHFWRELNTTLLISNRHIETDEVKGSITIGRWLPITKDLSEGTLYDVMEEVQGGVIIAENAMDQFVSQDSLSSKQPSPTPNTGASPH